MTAPLLDPTWDAVRERDLVSACVERDWRDSRACAALTSFRAERERALRLGAARAIINAHEEAKR